MMWLLAVPFVASGLCVAGGACKILQREEDADTAAFFQIAVCLSAMFFVLALKVAS